MIYVLDGFDIVDCIETKRSVIWNVQYTGFSEFELVIPGTDENIDKITAGRYLLRAEDKTDGKYENVMLIEKINLSFSEDDGWLLTVSGEGLKALLKRRVIWTQTNIEDTVENGIRTLINENVISPSESARKIDDFILDTAVGLTDEFETQVFGENLGEYIKETCETYNYGWDIYINNRKYVFRLFTGTDRHSTVTFSRDYDNLQDTEYEYTLEEYKNAALVGGEGEGTDQRYASIGTATGLDRYEAYIDGSDVSSNGEIITLDTYIELLKEHGKQELAQTSITQTLSGEVVPNGMFKLNVDYFLGDIVHIKAEKGISANARISEIIYSEDENGVLITPTFSNWEVEA